MKGMVGVGFVAAVLAAALSCAPGRPQSASANGTWTEHLPADLVRELLHCDHQQRPERECFARLSEAVARHQSTEPFRMGQGRSFRT
ncbi:MAG: hypothetical protein JOZ58_16090 [Acetobacteraceae bacterium]|nr:hypothetical protein [Acetobacteraceae bacterium]